MSQTFGRFHCNYCQENISGLRIRCVECDDFDLCLQCFACGAEIGPHKNNHSYQFMDPGSFVLFGNCDWRAREDVRLLDAIEQYGYGNWVDIAKHIEHRSADEAQERYITYFVDGELGQATLGQCQHEQGGDCAVAVDHTAPSGGQLSASLSPGLSPLNIDPLHASQLIYMPLRDDFEREFDNECEQLVSQLNIGSVEDEEIDTALKLAHVDMYVARIRERARRKRVARDFQLASAFFDELHRDALLQVPGGARMPRRKRERTSLSVQLRVLGQFLTRAEFERFHKNLQTQRDLLHRVKELIRYRRNGITRLEDCVEFERSKAKREQDPTKKSQSKRRKRPRYNKLKERTSRYWRYILAQRAVLDEQHQQQQTAECWQLSVGVARR